MFSSLLIILPTFVAAISGMRIGGRILGGEVTHISSYPYQVLVGVHLKDDSGFNCGGSIIGENWVLTAAHCIHSNISYLTVTDHASSQSSGGSIHTVDEYYVHEGYIDDDELENSGINDITLIHVVEPFSKRDIIDMWKPNQKVPVGSVAVVSGYGFSDKKYFYQPKLTDDGLFRVVVVPIVSDESCKKAYSGVKAYLGVGTLCAGYLHIGGKSSCQGDSGGPLVVNGRLAGVVSYGMACGDPKFPAVYTKVSHYYNWIRNKMFRHNLTG